MGKKEKSRVLDTFASVAPSLDLDLDTSEWTAGPRRFAQVPSWSKNGMRKPTTKRDLENSKDSKMLKKISPFKNLTIYPSIDPYPPQDRQLWTLLMQKCWPILKANQILQQLTIQKSTRSVLPRQNQEINDEALNKWENEKITIPLLGEEMSPAELKNWMDEYCATLDLDSLVFDAYMFEREQGRTVIGMFPEVRNKDGKYVLPTALRLIRPQLLRRPVVDFDNGELVGVEVTGLSSNGSMLDGNRCVYFNNSKNNELFGDFYGISALRAIDDLGQALLIIYSRDIINAANRTWRTPNIYQHELPTSKYSKAKDILEEFNRDIANAGNADVSIPHNVTVVNSTTNSGDISGLLEIERACIEGIAGHNHVPLFQLSKGEAGNMGGNANREENESLLNDEIKPAQERYEETLEKQFYDRILAILFMVEPDEIDQVPIKFVQNYEKPTFNAEIPEKEWQIMMFLVDNGFTTMEKVMERFGIKEMMADSPTQGTDTSPTRKTWEKQKHDSWGQQGNSWDKASGWPMPQGNGWGPKGGWSNVSEWGEEIMQKKVDVLEAAKEHLQIKNKLEKKKLAKK